ncbi:hypothetical protein JTB14_016623 [Gonioctena quinquepunctata]|nr:hypothetical protein JTB14_016623 [Gonioctena quinquepunctata]
MVCKSGFFGKWVFQYLATVTGTFSLMSYGVNTCWTSPYLPYLLSNSSIIPMTSDQASWCAIAPLIGCLPGALVAANIADRIGRKYTILIMAPVVSAVKSV